MLEQFAKTWKYHNPLTEQQLEFHDLEATVQEVCFYHSGDELYRLSNVPGVWHEQCLGKVHGE